MTASIIYWISVLHNLNNVLVLLLCIFGVGTFAAIVMYFCLKYENEKEPFSWKYLVAGCIIIVLLTVAKIFIPNSQNYLLMELISNSKQQTISNPETKLLFESFMRKYCDDLLLYKYYEKKYKEEEK